MHEEHKSLGGGNACYHVKMFYFALFEVLTAALMEIRIRLTRHQSTRSHITEDGNPHVYRLS